jgi:hypothetical protein
MLEITSSLAIFCRRISARVYDDSHRLFNRSSNTELGLLHRPYGFGVRCSYGLKHWYFCCHKTKIIIRNPPNRRNFMYIRV